MPTDTRTARASGALIIVAAVTSLLFMAMHPAIHAHDAGFADEMARKAALAATVHGALIAIMFVGLLGFVGLTESLADRPLLACAGLIALALGAIAHTAAATINGFIVPNLTARFASHGDAAMSSLRPLLSLCREANSAAASLGVVAMSTAIVLWSAALVRRPGAARLVGAFGLLIGGALIAVMLTGVLEMNVRGFSIRVAAQSAWWLAAGALLVTRPRA